MDVGLAIIFQGTADLVVPPATADRIAAQWATIDGIDAVADQVEYGQVPGGRSYTRTTYRDAAGQSLIEQYMIDGAGHAYPGGCACSPYALHTRTATNISTRFMSRSLSVDSWHRDAARLARHQGEESRAEQSLP